MTEELLAEVHRWRDSDRFDEAEQAALDLAERFATDHRSIDEHTIDGLRPWFDDGEIVDLVLCIAKYVAIGRVVRVLELDHTCPVPGAEGT